MGSWHFYLEIKTTSEMFKIMLQEYNKNSIYKTAFYLGSTNPELSDKFNVGISAYIDNFLPANHLIYKFLTNNIQNTTIIRANGLERKFNFSEKADFINFMYKAWEQKIDFSYSHFGTVLFDYEKYMKMRMKIYKKYYKKL